MGGALFLLAVFGLASSIAVLKAGKPLRNFLKARAGTREATSPISPAFYAGRTAKKPSPLEWIFIFLSALVHCPPCLAFWIGIAASHWVMSPAAEFCEIWWQARLVDGLAGCGFSWPLHAFIMKARLGIENVL